MKNILVCLILLCGAYSLSAETVRSMVVYSSSGGTTYPISEIDSVIFITIIDSSGSDTLVDDRDGRKYPTVTIGDQTWMAANLDYGTAIAGSLEQTDNGTVEKYYYEDGAYGNTYGGLYLWDEAMQYSATEGSQGVCPDGWHIPTDAEWKILEIVLGMSQSAVDAEGLRGTDQGTQLKQGGTSGFNGLLAGLRIPWGMGYAYLGAEGYFWSSTSYEGWGAYHRSLESGETQVSRIAYDTNYGFCIRCIKD